MVSSRLVSVLIILSLFSYAFVDGEQDFYNILSFDGGGIRGLISATVASYMEDFAYTYARTQYCIPERNNGKVSMTEVFDLLAGTSTGSIIASGLSMPNPDGTNKFFAPDVVDIFKA